ncbi:hypothetical protein NLU13_3800 [Sarocladium strictum]|uniref:Terpene synthase n=1 Tax=Sarocladium strictum TaxID=5046 RepID=A0AA39GII1_SARSR|nr:hypothetical protein NLU13_3800 [Sarocladium strictum]
MSSEKRAALSHDAIIARLRGQTLRVPDLTAIFAGWPTPPVNPRYQSLRDPVHQVIGKISTKRPSSQRRQNDDLSLLTSLWYPAAPYDRLRTLAMYTVWLVCWDDEVDANEGDLAGDFAKAEAWRQETLDMVRAAFGLSENTTALDVEDSLHRVIMDVGSDLRQSYSTDQRQHVFDKISLFIRSCAEEQKLQLDKIVPDYDTYMSMRLQTVGGDTLCSLIEFSSNGHERAPLGFSSARHEIDKQVSVLLSLLNDLLSLKKELRTECVINAVATLMTDSNTLESVVADIIGKMGASVTEFDDAAKQLENSLTSQGQQQAVREYVNGCRSIITGTLEFTLKSPRYKLASLLADDGSLEVVL